MTLNMQRGEYKRDNRNSIIRYLDSLNIVSAARAFFKKKNPQAVVRYEGETSSRVGGSDIQAESYRPDPKSRDIFGPDRVDFIGDFEVYKLVRDTFKKQGLSYRADYYRTAWDRNGGAKLTPQTTG